MTTKMKNWNEHVQHAELIARTPGFADLRAQILALADVGASERVLDVGAGTGLLTLPLCACAEDVWAIDIAPSMCDYLRTKAASASVENLTVAVASADNLPMVDACVDVVVSNYCLHHLDDDGKRAALAEMRRVLRPGGRIVFGDMMFSLGIADARDRQIVAQKMRSLLRKGPGGAVRLARNAVRIAGRRWEQPVPAQWWRLELARAGFVDVRVTVLAHEGGIACARAA